MASGVSAGPSRRALLAMVLLGFVLVATGVIARRVYGVGQSKQLRDLDRRRDSLQAVRIRLDSAIRDASSRARLEPIAEQRLNMHIALPEQQIILTRKRPQ